MAVTARQRPDFRTVSDSRTRQLTALGGLFMQVLMLCQAARLVPWAQVALDGTKTKANASKQKAMRNGRRQKTEADRAEVAAEGGDPRRARGYGVRPGASRGCIADVGGRQAGAVGENSARHDRDGSREAQVGTRTWAMPVKLRRGGHRR